jgi:hypothetical protein
MADMLSTLRNTFHTQTELYSEPLNKALHSHTYHSSYPNDVVIFSSNGSHAPQAWHGIKIANQELLNRANTISMEGN